MVINYPTTAHNPILPPSYSILPTLLHQHGIGRGSFSIMMTEIFKILHYADIDCDVRLFRIGTSGGLGKSRSRLRNRLRNTYRTITIYGDRGDRLMQLKITSTKHL